MGVGSRTEKYLNLRWSDELLWVIADVMACSQWKRTWRRKHSTMSEELYVKNLHQIFPKFYMRRLCDIGLFTAFARHDDILGLSIDLLLRPWLLHCFSFWTMTMWTSICLGTPFCSRWRKTRQIKCSLLLLIWDMKFISNVVAAVGNGRFLRDCWFQLYVFTHRELKNH